MHIKNLKKIELVSEFKKINGRINKDYSKSIIHKVLESTFINVHPNDDNDSNEDDVDDSDNKKKKRKKKKKILLKILKVKHL